MILVQNPSLVQGTVMSVYNDGPFGTAPSRAEEEHRQLLTALHAAGVATRDITETLLTIDSTVLRTLALKSVLGGDDRRSYIERNLVLMSNNELVDLIVQRPRLQLTPAFDLAEISPDGHWETYSTQPLAGLMFPRDHFIALPEAIMLARFRRADRRRESAVIRTVLGELAPDIPVFESPGFLEGGDVLHIPGARALVVSEGFRTSAEAIESLSQLAAERGVATVVVRDELRRPTEFHLDHWCNVTRNALHLRRERVAHNKLCRWRPGDVAQPWRESSLAEVLDRMGCDFVPVNLPQPEGLNYVYVPSADCAILPSGHCNLAEHLRRFVASVASVSTQSINSNYGGPHCATNEITV